MVVSVVAWRVAVGHCLVGVECAVMVEGKRVCLGRELEDDVGRRAERVPVGILEWPLTAKVTVAEHTPAWGEGGGGVIVTRSSFRLVLTARRLEPRPPAWRHPVAGVVAEAGAALARTVGETEAASLASYRNQLILLNLSPAID